MQKWSEDEIEKAARHGWILYNENDKPMVDATCFRCNARFQGEPAEKAILPLFCPKCKDNFKEGLTNGKE